jgi:hypothetical protein
VKINDLTNIGLIRATSLLQRTYKTVMKRRHSDNARQYKSMAALSAL